MTLGPTLLSSSMFHCRILKGQQKNGTKTTIHWDAKPGDPGFLSGKKRRFNVRWKKYIYIYNMYTHHWYLFVGAPLKNRLRLGCGFIRLSCFTPTPWSGQWFPIWKHVQWQPAVYAIEYGTVKLLPRDKTSGPGNQVTKKMPKMPTLGPQREPSTKKTNNLNQYQSLQKT